MPPKRGIFINNNRQRGQQPAQPQVPIHPYLQYPPPHHYLNSAQTHLFYYNFLIANAQADPVLNRPRGNIVSANNQPVRTQRWMMTITIPNNLPHYHLPNPTLYGHNPGRIVYVVGQYEVGNRNHAVFGNHRHIQLYLETDARVTWVHIMAAFGFGLPFVSIIPTSNIWLNPSYADDSQEAIDYVTKEDTRDLTVTFDSRTGGMDQYNDEVNQGSIDWGERPPGRVHEQNNMIARAIRAGADFEELVAKFGNIVLRYGSSYRNLIWSREKNHPPPEYEKMVTVFWGDPGTGKTRAVYDAEGTTKVYNKIGGKFFDGYNPKTHEAIVFDDYVGDRSNNVNFTELLKILDRYPFSVELKGCSTYIRAKRIYITSNLPPYQWFPHATPEQLGALYRRFNCGVWHWAKNGPVTEEHFIPEDYVEMARRNGRHV